MIDRLLAERLIEKVSQFTDYNVNIMDENGIIIASRMKERVGTFHEVAFQLLKGDEDTRTVMKEDSEKGVKCGINMVVHVNKRKEGVVGITGDPKEVTPIAKVIRMSVEVMLEYELFKYENLRKYNLKEQLLHLIMHSDNFAREDLEKYTSALRLDENIIRVPILIACPQLPSDQESAMALFGGAELFTRQDFMDRTREGFLLIFKAIDCSFGYFMQDYQSILADYLAPFLRYAQENKAPCRIYIGPMQNDIMYYHQAYLDCVWMQKNIDGDGIFYFYDYVVQYLASMASPTEFHTIFSLLRKELGEKSVEQYIEIMGALIHHEYNLAHASASLHIHKNTLVYRLDKIRERLNRNPVLRNTDRELLECFYYYLKRK